MRAESLADPALVEWCRDPTREEGEGMRPTLHRVVRLARKEHAAALPAGTAPDTLCIGTDPNLLAVRYRPREGLFEIRRRERSAGRGIQWQCGSLEGFVEAERLVDAFLLRLAPARLLPRSSAEPAGEP